MSTCQSGKKSSSTINNYSTENFSSPSHPVFCYCGIDLIVQTSWTKTNPGRRFVSCSHREAKKCEMFVWIDPPMCARSKQIIPGLLKKINSLESQLELKKIDGPKDGFPQFGFPQFGFFCVLIAICFYYVLMQ